MKTWIWACLVAVAILVGVLLVRRGSEQAPAGPLVPGQDTTRITEPLDADGNVDYVAALNAGERPSPEENGAIGILHILGTGAMQGERAEALRLLGAPEGLPVNGSFVPDNDDLLDPLVDQLLGRASEESAINDPGLRKWVNANESALNELIEATSLPAVWLPAVRGTNLIDYCIPLALVDKLALALVARAEVRRKDGLWQAALHDIRAVLLLGARSDSWRGSLGRFVSCAISRHALAWIAWLARTNAVTPAEAKDLLVLARSVPDRRGMRDDLDRFDRFVLLDSLIRETQGSAAVHPTLRTVNAGFDEVVALLTDPDAETLAAIQKVVDDRQARIQHLTKDLKRPLGFGREIFEQMASDGERAREQIGEVVLSQALVILPFAHRRVRSPLRHWTVVALAAHVHKLRTGAYPQALRELVPDTLDALPVAFDGKPIPYEVTDERIKIGVDNDAIELAK